MLEDILRLRAACTLLSELDESALRALAPSLEEVRVSAGTDLIREGERADRPQFIYDQIHRYLTCFATFIFAISEIH